MKILRFVLTWGCILFTFLAGCSKPAQTKMIDKVCLPNIGRDTAMQAAETILSQMHFEISKADGEKGFIKTYPLCGAQVFEFWRKDNVGRFNTAEANLHSLRRIVEIDMDQQDGQLCINCNVRTQKLMLTDRQVEGSYRAYELFSKSRSNLQRLKLDDREKAWIELGEDKKLATSILNQINYRLTSKERTQ